MLKYISVPETALDQISSEGLLNVREEDLGVEPHSAPGKAVLVVDVETIHEHTIPTEAVLNLNPYRAPLPTTAGGGLVIRGMGDNALVLLIFRKGTWDLPKGKCNPGEATEACALREVREEVGIEHLEILAPVGMTVHTYPEGSFFRVKTTHWFLMETAQTQFVPEEREGISAVEWASWTEARRMLGYPTLQDLLMRASDQATHLLSGKTRRISP